MIEYFPDTNLFLECRKASALPWHELSGQATAQDETVRLVIPPTVITEIERNKGRGNDRKAKRARDTWQSYERR